MDQAEDSEEKNMLEKIQRTYEKYLEKKQKRPPKVSKEFKEE